MSIINYRTLALYRKSTKGYLFTTAGTYTQRLRPGTYTVKIHGGGGAGGESGGAGGVGQYKVETLVITSPAQATIVVGAGGLTHQNGGNGGARGVSGNWGESYQSGAGGGGGHTSYISFVTDSGEQVLFALGGGGGGGAGASTPGGRYASGGAGGGGGGYYRFDPATKTEEDVPGQRGANGAAGRSYANGEAGLTGNTTDFAQLYSAAGGTGWRTYGGGGASGGGASGGGGGEGGNDSSGFGGRGGGGAGGDLDAGGGNGAANAHTVPTPSIDNEGNSVTSGWGIGGEPGQNGTDGWVFIVRTGAAQLP